MIKEAIKTFAIKAGGKLDMFWRRHGNDILTYGGVFGMASGTVIACVATTKLDTIVDEANDDIKEAKANEDDKALKKAYVKAAGKIVKLYAPAFIIEVLSGTAIISSHGRMKKDKASLVAAYAAISESYRQYRKKVREDQGEEKDEEYYEGTKTTPHPVVNDDGTIEPSKERVSQNIMPYQYIFSYDTCVRKGLWKTNGINRHAWLRGKLREAELILQTRGYIFLNEVLDMVNLPRTSEGQWVGWVMGMGDDRIDCGLDRDDAPTRMFRDGDEDTLLMTFNCDGDIMYIFDKVHSDKPWWTEGCE